MTQTDILFFHKFGFFICGTTFFGKVGGRGEGPPRGEGGMDQDCVPSRPNGEPYCEISKIRNFPKKSILARNSIFDRETEMDRNDDISRVKVTRGG